MMNDNELLNFFAGLAMQSNLLGYEDDGFPWTEEQAKLVATDSFLLAKAMVEESKKYSNKSVNGEL